MLKAATAEGSHEVATVVRSSSASVGCGVRLLCLGGVVRCEV
jgi:hypothetical protein